VPEALDRIADPPAQRHLDEARCIMHMHACALCMCFMSRFSFENGSLRTEDGLERMAMATAKSRSPSATGISTLTSIHAIGSAASDSTCARGEWWRRRCRGLHTETYRETHRDREKHRDREIQRETERTSQRYVHRERETETDRDRQRHRERHSVRWHERRGARREGVPRLLPDAGQVDAVRPVELGLALERAWPHDDLVFGAVIFTPPPLPSMFASNEESLMVYFRK
jgi:hypothetical protein